MITNTVKRSPLFYVGDKYKLIAQIKPLFPHKVNTFFEPFVGGGSVFLNVDAKNYYLNDVDENLIKIHKYLVNIAEKPDYFFNNIEKIIDAYDLSRSYKEDIVPDILKRKWKKTYFARFNKPGYTKLRESFNKHYDKDPLILYVLLIYGFNRMLRFNGKGEFNLPVGNVDFNNNVIKALNDYFDYVKERKVIFESRDFRKFLYSKEYSEKDFIYFDPPYLITFSEYNKFWNEKNEIDLLNIIDELNKKGIKFALSNVIEYKGRENKILSKWMNKYNIYTISSNYISYNNNSKKDIKEVLITNYGKNN